MSHANFAHHVSLFFTRYLPVERSVSPNTLKAYRDTFVLLLRYLRDVRGWAVEQADFKDMDAQVVVDFLEFLEKTRACRASTLNHRLAALRSFFRYVQTEAPECLAQCQRVLSIRRQRAKRPEMRYLTAKQVQVLLRQPDQNTPNGKRDAAMLSLLYDVGARVQELLNVNVEDVQVESPASVRLTGKGRKTRLVPLMSATAALLKEYMAASNITRTQGSQRPLFLNRHGRQLSRFGVGYLVDKYVMQARLTCPDLNFPISPHTLRHTRAMHLLEANIPLVIIRDFLDHADINTTEIYARASLKMKQEALSKVENVLPRATRPGTTWTRDDGLLTWLEAL